jgi:hypothetical protein
MKLWTGTEKTHNMKGEWCGGKGSAQRPCNIKRIISNSDFLSKKRYKCYKKVDDNLIFLDVVETSSSFLAARYLGVDEEELHVEIE